jgi:hypothetical protein
MDGHAVEVSVGNQRVMWRAGRKLVETSDRLASFPRPEKPITLYEFEGCPFCRKVWSPLCGQAAFTKRTTWARRRRRW